MQTVKLKGRHLREVVWQSGGRYLGCWQELSEQAVGDILKKEAFLRVSRMVWGEAGERFFSRIF